MSWFEQGRKSLKKWSDRRRQRRFNCGDQADVAWIDRAKIAVDMASATLAAAVAGNAPVRIADIGCGDGKFGRLLQGHLPSADYQGYDLAPQSDVVNRFNVDSDSLDQPCDLAVLLGVLEYSKDLDAALARLRPMCRHLLLSHAVSDRRENPKALAKRLNWATHLTEAEFAARLGAAGFIVIDRRLTSNDRTVLWACR